MTPFFFGSSRRQLFGAYDSPPAGGRRGAVLCYPWAREYLLAHGTFRHLARMLADAGYHVLRFDYSSTGDSAGEFDEASAEQWVADIHTAIDELRETAQLGSVTLIGLRYGATLAAMAASGRSDVDRLVLWDPVADGKSYLSGMGVGGLSRAKPMEKCEVQGVVLTAQMRQDIERVSPQSFGARLPPALLLTTAEPANTGLALRMHLSAIGADVTGEHVPDISVWALEWNRGGVRMPVTAVRTILAWMS